MADARERVVCLLASGFEDSEFRRPYERLHEVGFDVDVVGFERGRQLEGLKGRQTVLVDKTIDSVKPEDYVAMLIPGGLSPDLLRADARFLEFVREFDARKKPIFAICHGPQLLMTAGLVKGRTLTAWSTVQQDLKYAGAIVKDEPLVRDGHWVTSRKPEDLDVFCEALVKTLR
jgi:protease I